MTLTGRAVWGFLLGVTGLRWVVAAWMPLAADEAYYRVWARALAAGYLDHPPMVALWIRAGMAVAGDTPLGVRFFGPVSALLGSLLLFWAGEDLAFARGGAGRGVGARAVWLLNGTLLLNAGAVVATPDTPLLLFWTAAIAALARIVRTGDGRWWLGVGAAAGLAFESKYSAGLLAPVVVAWLVAVPGVRFWLLRWEPYAGACVALGVASPVVWWNATHGWASFARQGGRVGDWHVATAVSHVAELVAGQIGLATPVIFAMFCAGVWACVRRGGWRAPATGLAAALVLVPGAVFLQHALGDRVQANWPAVLYPGAALAAGFWPVRGQVVAVASGLAMSGLMMLQAAAAPFTLPRRVDFSLIRLAGWGDLARAAEAARVAAGAECLAADDYALASELAYRAGAPVLGTEARWRYFALPPAPASCSRVLMVRSVRRGKLAGAPEVGSVARARDGVVAETYLFYVRSTPMGAVLLPSRD